VLDRGMAKEPSERWGSARDMVDALDRAMSGQRPPTEPTRPIAAAPPPPRRSGVGPWLVAGLAALLLLVAAGAVLLSGGDEGGEPRSQATATPTAERTPDPTREPTAEPTEKPTEEPTAEPTAEATPTATAEPSGQPDLDRAADLQLQGFNARQAGNYEQALGLSQQALEACGDVQQLSPCGYALFEVGAALNALGRPDEAIPYLEQRLEQYGDNSAGEVKRELEAAKEAAKGNGKGKGKGEGDD
jgi:tetratricopeptide (TPR) repeat protein